MSRTRVAALALVNWKGVFFERYLLDRHVTALEGANGAGKTTVMIAAYVVLLPDMTRLRFTNLGESGATGGDRGIWGRLGELGRPAYAALDLDLDGERVVLGVCLARTTEPTVEPTAFMVSGLSEATRLSEFLLVRRDDGDHVPELAEVKSSVARVGGSIQVFRSVKEYFSALFDRGITPLCLSFEEERNKWNDMLRTSMTGGISRALGSELRSFLLREESGLSDTLSRMRDNLESCRRTRVEVFEARKLEREISAIYEAGLAMFSAALQASRVASLEARARAREAAEASSRAQEAHVQLTEEAAQLQLREADLAQQSEQKRSELTQLEAAMQRTAAAALLSARLAGLEAELSAAERKLSAGSAEQQDKERAREAAKQARQWTLEAYDRASVGLASLQKGLEELARRAHAHKELARCLDEARELLSRSDLGVRDAEAVLSELAQQRGELETERASLSRHGRDLEARREEHGRALEALGVLEASTLLSKPGTRHGDSAEEPADLVAARVAVGAGAGEQPEDRGNDAAAGPRVTVGAGATEHLEDAARSDAHEVAGAPLSAASGVLEAHERARGLLARAAELEASSARFVELEGELRTARRLRVRQDAARGLAAELGVAVGGERGERGEGSELDSPGVSEQLTALEGDALVLESRLHPDADALAARQRLVELRREHAGLDQRAACYQLAQAAAVRLVQTGALRTDNAEGLALSSARALNSSEVGAADESPAERAGAHAEHAVTAGADGREAGAREAGAARGVWDSQAALLGLRDRLLREQLALGSRRDVVEAERERMQAQAAQLNRGAAMYDVELLRVRDELGAELLAARFEDLEPAQAAWVQARLGPWVDALVVDDVAAAMVQLTKLEHELRNVHLVRAGESLDVVPPEAESGDAITVQEAFGTRISKLPLVSDLGRRAREAKLQELWAAIEARAATLDELGAATQSNAAQRRDADVLWTHAALWLGPDPLAQREALEAEIARIERADNERQVAAATARKQLVSLRARAEGLRRLLPDAQLLGAPDYTERVRELEASTALLSRARAELLQLSAARASLARFLDVLRSPPPDDSTHAQQGLRSKQLEVELDRIFRARSALEGVLALRHAADFADAQQALDAQAELSPAIEQQQQQARQQLQAAEVELNSTLSAWEIATSAVQGAQAERNTLATQRQRLLQELSDLGVEPPDTELTQETEELQLLAAKAELQRLAEAARRSVAERALAEERCVRAQAEVQAARARQVALLAEAEPVERAWNELREAADSAGVLHGALSQPTDAGRSSFQLQAEARSKRELLLDRVLRARSGEELQQAIVEARSDLASWQAVRAWLSRRVPVQVAQVQDPLIALTRLSDHLNMLEARLNRQEGDLRGSSEDVARGIAVQLRRAQSQVRRLNQQLDGIRFGSIHAIRIEMRRIERMEQILRALREGQAQELLFSSSLPIEEALDEIFKRYGGGGKSGGQRLLDYREYVELAVEIRRQNAETWEPANPTRLSTGEAIGVGAALMMVVLTEWERAASLLGPRNKLGSLRFLFLDEANRLSRDNLGVLFDLCRTLDLQLLVAAPEVARADGNTTYRLVRHTTEAGREEVIVSGRRSVPAAGEEAPATEALSERSPAASSTEPAPVSLSATVAASPEPDAASEPASLSTERAAETSSEVPEQSSLELF